jgi:hypothetical protein
MTTIRFATRQQEVLKRQLEACSALAKRLTVLPLPNGYTPSREEVSAAISRCYTHLQKGINPATCDLLDLVVLEDCMDASSFGSGDWGVLAGEFGRQPSGWARSQKLLKQKHHALRAAIAARTPNWTADPSDGPVYPVMVRSAWITEELGAAIDSAAGQDEGWEVYDSFLEKLEHFTDGAEACALWLTAAEIAMLNEQLSWYEVLCHDRGQEGEGLAAYAESKRYGRYQLELVAAAALAGYTEKVEQQYA